MEKELEHIDEPDLLFDHDQSLPDPRDGLALFGPYQKKSFGIKFGIIGHRDGIERVKKWIKAIQSPVYPEKPSKSTPPFLGFETIFRIPFGPDPVAEIRIDYQELKLNAYLDDAHQRVYNTVDLFYKELVRFSRDEDENVDIWIVVIPEFVYKNCRPQSYVGVEEREEASNKMDSDYAKSLRTEPSLFPEEQKQAIPYQYELNFHNQLKARLLNHFIPTQIVRETTIAPQDFLNSAGYPIRQVDDKSAIAWNLCNGIFYKAAGRPWKLASVRKKVCYLGLVFKQDETNPDPRNAVCAAQMFLDSGDGIVFRGNVGPWYNPDKGSFHFRNKKDAKELIEKAIQTYKDKDPDGDPPNELFIHGKTRFNQIEWEGFTEAAGQKTKVVGIRIINDRFLKLFKKGHHAVLRSLAYIEHERKAYLWTKGFIPRIETYDGAETPNPLLIEINKGEADIKMVLKDILALTKLNYNACDFADGQPVTLRFADSVGEILTAGPDMQNNPLAFKYYI